MNIKQNSCSHKRHRNTAANSLTSYRWQGNGKCPKCYSAVVAENKRLKWYVETVKKIMGRISENLSTNR